MERDTILLLRECDAGVKMGLGSFEHVKPSVTGDKMKQVMEKYKKSMNPAASPEAVKTAKEIVKTEEEFMKELEAFL